MSQETDSLFDSADHFDRNPWEPPSFMKYQTIIIIIVILMLTDPYVCE